MPGPSSPCASSSPGRWPRPRPWWPSCAPAHRRRGAAADRHRAGARPAAAAQAWQELPSLALVMFVSANAVQHFMRQRPPAVAWPAQLLAGSTGPGTSAALREAGVPRVGAGRAAGRRSSTPRRCGQQLRARDWQGRRVLVVRGEGGRDWLAEQLRPGRRQRRLRRRLRAPCCRGCDAHAAGAARRGAGAGRSSTCGPSAARRRWPTWQLLAPGADWSAAPRRSPRTRASWLPLQRLGFGQVRLVAVDAAAWLAAAAREGRSIQSAAS